MPSLKEIFEKAQETGKVEYTYFGGGISTTPFTQTSIPFNDKEGFGQVFSEPFIKRGYDPSPKFISFDPTNTYNTALAAGIDTVRITKLLSTSVRGVTWLTKQVGLQRSNPDLSYKTVVDPNNKEGELENTRLYNITGVNTISQVAAVGLGTHITRHGLTPSDGTNYIDLNTVGNEFQSRLSLYNGKIQKSNGYVLLNQYQGGPDYNVFFGIGKTQITSYQNTLGLNTGVTNKPGYLEYNSTLPLSSDQTQLSPNLLNFQPFSYENINSYSNSETKNKLANISENSAKYPKDFRRIKGTEPNSNYPELNIHKRIGVTSNQNNIGSPNTVDSINILKITPSSTFYSSSISARSPISDANLIYSKGYVAESVIKKVDGFYGRDLIKFRIEVLNNDNPVIGTGAAAAINTDVLAFRAYIENMDDNFTSQWKEFNYMGRGEPFYTYEGFKRNINLTYTIFAHSEEEMSIVWTKINYLMSMMAPDYNTKNQMRGNYVYLTVGDYIYRQPGIVDSLNFTNLFGDNQTGWEIALNEPESEADVFTDNQGTRDFKQYEIPKMVKVQMSFKPIHNFLPKRMYNEDKMPNNTATFVTPNHMLLPSRYNRYLPSPPRPTPTNTQ
jgi:hypothetical protein